LQDDLDDHPHQADAALREFATCLIAGADRLDDLVSPADVVAAGILASCGRQLQTYLGLAYPDQPPAERDDLAQESIFRKTAISLVLEARAAKRDRTARMRSLRA
jgi:hypothetical protein